MNKIVKNLKNKCKKIVKKNGKNKFIKLALMNVRFM